MTTRKLSTPFATNSTLINQVPVSQTSDSQASYDIGFPPKNFQTIANGGVAVDGKDFNGLLNDITGNIVDLNKGLPQYFDSAYSTLIGGYPLGARLCLNDNSGYVVSTIHNNTNDPNTSMIGWSDTRVKEYDFKTQQPIQYYYDKLGNWDDAIYEAQKNIYLKGYSNVLRLPVGNIEITRPIYGGQGLIEYMAQKNPEIDTSGQWIPLTLIGAPRSTEGRPEDNLGTQIVFKGIKSATDLTWANYGIIHSAPLDYKKMESDDIKNPASVILRDINIRPDNINLGASSVHGIVIRNGSKHYFQNVTVYGCYGAGFYGSWIFDSQFDQLTVIRCGRMSPDSSKFMTDDNLDAQYQTYAPVHITQPDTHVGDNSNFLYFHKLHLEDNTYANGDIIINGDSSPIIFYDSHHETDGNGVASKGLKTCVLLGGYGVKYFGQDQESGFDYTNFAKTNRAGYATLVNATVYSSDYAYASKQTSYCAIAYHSANLGGLPIYVYSYNSGGSVTLENTSIGEFIHEGFTDRGNLLTASQSTIGNIYLGRGSGSGGSVSLVNCDCGAMSIGSNSIGSWANYLEVRATNTKFTSLSGSYPNFFGDIELSSSSTASTFTVLNKCDLDIRTYNFLETAGA